jgi:two-component system copper resistance phosphate regulon response regulator CusR
VKILVIEDEQKTASYLQKGLTESGFVTDVARQGEEGLRRAMTEDYDLILLDVMLPGRDGWSIRMHQRASVTRAAEGEADPGTGRRPRFDHPDAPFTSALT